jgi:hypothetical protein
MNFTSKMTLHRIADGPAQEIISVKRRSKAFKSSQATCSIEDIIVTTIFAAKF